MEVHEFQKSLNEKFNSKLQERKANEQLDIDSYTLAYFDVLKSISEILYENDMTLKSIIHQFQ